MGLMKETTHKTIVALLLCLSVSLLRAHESQGPQPSCPEPGSDSEAAGALKPGSPVDYAGLAFYPSRWKRLGLSTELIPWTGKQVVFLTTTAELDTAVMGRVLSRLDGGWKLYADLTGKSPRLFKHIDGKPTISAVPKGELTCGYGCGYIGATGIEVSAFYRIDYPQIRRAPDAFPHYYFYEMGRNFYTFGDRHSLFVTGYAVFMRYVCMDALKCVDKDRKTRVVIEQAEELYSKSELSYLQAFTNLTGMGEKGNRLKKADGKPLVPSDQPVMYASAMLHLRRLCGGDAWLERFFGELSKCREVKARDREGALRQSFNWLVAASCAARKDLSDVFVDRWKLPLAEKTRKALKEIAWGKGGVDSRTVLDSITPEFLPEKE